MFAAHPCMTCISLIVAPCLMWLSPAGFMWLEAHSSCCRCSIGFSLSLQTLHASMMLRAVFHHHAELPSAYNRGGLFTWGWGGSQGSYTEEAGSTGGQLVRVSVHDFIIVCLLVHKEMFSTHVANKCAGFRERIWPWIANNSWEGSTSFEIGWCFASFMWLQSYGCHNL